MSIARDRGAGATSARHACRVLTAAWLPGTTEVHVVGETFHEDAIRALHLGAQPGRDLKGMLAPEPDNPHDRNAVAVCMEGRQVGHLAASVAKQVQPALLGFSAKHSGQLVACPGRTHPRV